MELIFPRRLSRNFLSIYGKNNTMKKRSGEYSSTKAKKRWRNKADKLWYDLYIKPECEVCENKSVQCHHYYYKSSYPHLRYDEDNAVSLCLSCHFLLHHKDPKTIEREIVKKRGKAWFERLEKKAQDKPKKTGWQTIGYYLDVIEKLNESYYTDVIGKILNKNL